MKKNQMRQQQFSEDFQDESLPITVVAQDLAVSTATIRNWLKTGYLRPAGRGGVDRSSIEEFKKGAAGTEKLTSRANKSLRDSHNHSEITSVFVAKAKDPAIDPEFLGSDYEESLSNSFKNKEGIYYTPDAIVDDLLKSIPEPDSTTTLCDPCCGSGNFLIQAIRSGYSPSRVYGYDVDPVAVEITRRRIFDESGYRSDNIQLADFSCVATSGGPPTFDVVITNPPWGKKIPKPQKEAIGHFFSAGRSLDTSALFFLACLRSVKGAGHVGMLLPEAFSNISTWEDVRSRVLDHTICRLVDYGKPFKGLLTRAHGVVLRIPPPPRSSAVECVVNGNYHNRTQDSFRSNPRKIFNFHADEDDAEVIEYLYSLPHKNLRDKAKWALGIVTGNNKKYCRDTPSNSHVPIYRGCDISKNRIAPPARFLLDDFSRFQQVAPMELYEAPSKLVYKFISSELCFAHDTNKRLFLNSANILIPRSDFPVSPDNLCAILNSNLLSWFFETLFRTHKVLRADLEALPLHVRYFDTHHAFDEELYLSFLNIEKTNNGAYRIKTANH